MKKILQKKYYVMTFLLSLIYRMVQVAGVYAMRSALDDIGFLAAPAYFAGYDWSNVVSATRYYGIAYYIIFTPVLRWIDDPTLIWFIIVFSNIVLVSITCTLIFHIGIKYLSMKNDFFTATISVISSFVTVSSQSMSNEPVLFFLTWLIAYLLIKWVSSDKKKYITFIIFGVALYAYLVHTRAIVFVIAIILTLAIYIFKSDNFASKSKSLLYIIIIAVTTAIVGSLIKDFIVQLIWSTTDSIQNSDLPINSSIFSLFSLKGPLVLFDLFISNMVTTSNRLFCINSIAVIFVALLLLRKWKALENEYNISENKIIILLFSFMCFFIGICGVSALFGKGVVSTYLTDETNVYYKGLGYYRYYASFFGPAVFVSINECINNEKFKKVVKIPVISLQAIIYIYFFSAVVGRIEKSEYAYMARLEYFTFNGSGYDTLNYRLSILLAFGILIALFIVTNQSVYSKLVITSCLLIAVLPYLRNLENGIMTQPQLNSVSDAGYELFLELEAKDCVPEHIYCDSVNRSFRYQLPLKKYSITIGYPDNSATAILFTGSNTPIEYLDDSFICLKIDNNEYIWTNSTEIYDVTKHWLETK